MTETSYHNNHSVDNPSESPPRIRYNPRVAGILSGASRRFQSRNRHAEVRTLRNLGFSLRQIASFTGYHFSTVSRILSGVIRTCLNRAETLAAGPVKLLQNVRKRRGVARTNLYAKQEKESQIQDGLNCQYCGKVDGQVCPGCGFERVIRIPTEVLEREREQKPWLTMAVG